MTTRRGIFFNSKSRSADSNLILDEKNRSPTKTEPSSNPINNEDPTSGSSSNNSQTSPPKTTTTTTTTAIPAGIVKKKLILKSTKRTLTKTIYSGPRKIFSTSYKVSYSNFFY